MRMHTIYVLVKLYLNIITIVPLYDFTNGNFNTMFIPPLSFLFLRKSNIYISYIQYKTEQKVYSVQNIYLLQQKVRLNIFYP